jgi:hypothetical protein
MPPSIPISDGKASDSPKDGFMMHSAPANAVTSAATCTGFARSCRKKNEKMIAKNGDNLLSIEASDSTRWSTA